MDPAILKTTYPTLLILSGGVSLTVAILAYQHRKSPGGMPLVLMMVAMTLWSWTYAMDWLLPTWPAPYFWQDAVYLGVVSVPSYFLAFAIDLTNHQRWLKKQVKLMIRILMIEPILTLTLVWTDSYHRLFYGGLRTVLTTDFTNGGPWFWVNLLYSYGLIIAAFALLTYAWLRQRGTIYRNQIGICLIGLIFLFITNVLNMTGIKPLPGIDLTPIAFTLMGIFAGYSIVGFHLFDIVPVALDILVDQMSDGLIVLDPYERIIEINRSAAKLIGIKHTQLISKSLADILDHSPEFRQVNHHPWPEFQQIRVNRQSSQTMEIAMTRLRTPDGNLQGYLLTWRDVTHLSKVEEQLRATNETLEKSLAEVKKLQDDLREQVIRDPLTGLYNRRCLEEILPKEIARAERLKMEIIFMMIDVDHFKSINDCYGHSAGDAVLQAISVLLQGNMRKGDIVARVGGDEFLAILIDAHSHFAYQRAEDIRRRIVQTPIPFGTGEIEISISIGVAAYPLHGNTAYEIIRIADQALYEAKAIGRNHTCLALSNKGVCK
jgi:diguanylate cyclase (GGDEF)-like protein/PAS domain S-box-containing protein